MLIPQVLCDLAQPDGELAGAVKAVDGADGLVKGLLGQLLGKVFVVGLGEEEVIDRLGILAVNGIHILHRASSFPVVC